MMALSLAPLVEAFLTVTAGIILVGVATGIIPILLVAAWLKYKDDKNDRAV